MATSSSLEEFGMVMLTRAPQWKRDGKKPWMFSHHRLFFACGRSCQLATRVIEMLSGCLKLHRPIFSQPVCKNTRLSAKKCTRARSHCLFASVNPQKDSHTWEPRVATPSGVMRFSHSDNSPPDPFVRLLLFSTVFCFTSAQGLHASWRLMQHFSTKPGALDRPFRSVSAWHNLFQKLRNEFRGEVALWLRRESPLLADLCVSPQIYRTTLSQSAHCEINRNLSHAHRFRCARWNLAISAVEDDMLVGNLVCNHPATWRAV